MWSRKITRGGRKRGHMHGHRHSTKQKKGMTTYHWFFIWKQVKINLPDKITDSNFMFRFSLSAVEGEEIWRILVNISTKHLIYKSCKTSCWWGIKLMLAHRSSGNKTVPTAVRKASHGVSLCVILFFFSGYGRISLISSNKSWSPTKFLYSFCSKNEMKR